MLSPPGGSQRAPAELAPAWSPLASTVGKERTFSQRSEDLTLNDHTRGPGTSSLWIITRVVNDHGQHLHQHQHRQKSGFGAVPWYDALSCGQLARIWNEHDTTSQEDLPQGAQDTLPDWDALEFECRV